MRNSDIINESMQNKQSKVFLIILNWNGWKMTLDCLNSVNTINKNGFNLETLIVENGSTDGSVEKIEEKHKDLIILKNKKNLLYFQ